MDQQKKMIPISNSEPNLFTNRIQNLLNQAILMQIGYMLIDRLYPIINPYSPYYLRKRISYLTNQIIIKTCELNDEVIRP